MSFYSPDWAVAAVWQANTWVQMEIEDFVFWPVDYNRINRLS